MFQDSELVALLFTVAVLPVLPLVLRGLLLPGIRLFVLGFVFMVVAYVATVVEGILWYDAFNLVQHVAYAASGVTFLAAVLALRRAEREAPEAGR